MILFSRQGEELVANSKAPNGQPLHVCDRVCWRCGGLGGSEKWRQTGWTCFRCGGKGVDPTQDRIKLYTAEQIEKLNATAAKRNAKKAAAREEAERLERERIEREAAEIISMWQLFVERIDGELAHGESDFLTSVRDRIMLQAKEPTEAQVAKVNEVIDRNEAERERLAAATHVGEIGKRMVFDLTLLYHRHSKSLSYPFYDSYWTLFTDENGRKIASKSAPRALGLKLSIPEGGTWDDRCYAVGSKTRVKATVVEHTTDKKGEPVTYINRPKEA